MPVVAATARPTSPTTGTGSGGTFRTARSPQARSRSGATADCCRQAHASSIGAGWTPLYRAERLSELLDLDLHLKLESDEPDAVVQGPDRDARGRRRARPRRHDPLLLVDRQPRSTRSLRRRPRPGSRRSCSLPSGARPAAVAAAHPGARVFAVARHLRRLPPARARARARSSRGDSSAGTSTRTRARARRRSPSRSPSSSAGSCPMPSSAPRRAARSSRSSHRASPS